MEWDLSDPFAPVAAPSLPVCVLAPSSPMAAASVPVAASSVPVAASPFRILAPLSPIAASSLHSVPVLSPPSTTVAVAPSEVQVTSSVCALVPPSPVIPVPPSEFWAPVLAVSPNIAVASSKLHVTVSSTPPVCALVPPSPFIPEIPTELCDSVPVTPEVFDFKDVPPSRPSSCLSPGPPYVGPPLDDPHAGIWPFSVCPDWPINDEWLRFAFAPVVFTVDKEAEESSFYTLKNLLYLDNDNDSP
jgi:hypothetical protein